MACALIEAGSFDEAAGWSQRALANAAASGDQDAELDAIRARAMLETLPGFQAEMFQLGARAIELAGPTGRPLAQLWGHVWRSDTAIHMGDMTAAQAEIKRDAGARRPHWPAARALARPAQASVGGRAHRQLRRLPAVRGAGG